jgi:hypothetical protein
MTTRPKKMDPRFWIAYLILISAVFALELLGVSRPEPGDTITEGVGWIDFHLPPAVAWLFRALILGLLAWASMHFRQLFGG